MSITGVMRITDPFDRGVRLYPKNLAVVDDNQSLTYQECSDMSHYIATRLRSTPGLAEGSHAAIYSLNDANALLCLLATYRAEMVWIPINVRSSLEINIMLMNKFDVDFLFYHSQFESSIPEIREKVPRIKNFVCINEKGDNGPYLMDWIEGYQRKFEPTSSDPNAICAIMPSGGTTGEPKGTVRTHRDWTTAVLDAHAFWQVDVGTRHLVAAPMTHAAGLYVWNHFPKGGTNYLMKGVDVEKIMRTIQEERITHFFVPPTGIYMLLAHPDVRKYDYSSLVRFISAQPAAACHIQRSNRGVWTFDEQCLWSD